jgi:hypothetical protein
MIGDVSVRGCLGYWLGYTIGADGGLSLGILKNDLFCVSWEKKKMILAFFILLMARGIISMMNII